MADGSARLLRLLSLLAAGGGWTSGELARRLDVSARTVRRNVERLRRLGYPVSAGKGPGGVYRLALGGGLPLPFDTEQAVTLAVALRTTPATVAGLDAAAARALAAVRQVLPSRLRHRVDSIPVTSIDNPWNLSAPAVASEVLYAVGRAVSDRRVLRFDYPAGDADDSPSLQVEPHHLVVWGGRWYLVAWDLGRGEWRAFRVDRIRPEPATGRGFAPRPLPGDDVTAFVIGQFDRGDTTDHWPCRGEVLLEVSAADIARWAPGGAVVVELGPARCRANLGAWSWVGLAALIGTFGCDFEVIGPPELADACAQLSRRYAAAARAPGPGDRGARERSVTSSRASRATSA